MSNRKCHWCNSPEVEYVFKAHAPQINGSAEYCESVNQWMCDNCATTETRDGHKIINNPKFLKERHVKVRFVKQQLDSLSDNWEKDWHVGYGFDGYWVFFEPNAKIYWTATK